MNMARQDGIEARIIEFVDNLAKLYTADYARRSYLPFAGHFKIEYGTKNARIVIVDAGQQYGSVYCFIDLSNGDILKADGYKKPAKGARGSIWNDECDVRSEGPANVHGSGLYKK